MSDHRKVLPLPPNARAWEEGYRAGRRGCNDSRNPYTGDGMRARAWLMGLLEGRTKRLVVVRRRDGPRD